MDENFKSPDGPSADLSDRADHLSNIVREKFASQYASDRALLKAVNSDDRPELGHMLSGRFINEAEKRERQSRDIFWEEFKKAAGYYALRDSLHGDESRAKLLDDTKKDAKRFIEQYINNGGKGPENRQALRDILADYSKDAIDLESADDNNEVEVQEETEEDLIEEARKRRERGISVEAYCEKQSRHGYGRYVPWDEACRACGYDPKDVDANLE